MRLAVQIVSGVLVLSAVVTPCLRGRRISFGAFVALALTSFALRAGWPGRPLTPMPCEGVVGWQLARHSFRNTPHILLFALCFGVALAQFGPAGVGGRIPWRTGAAAFALTVVVGALVELAEGSSGAGHCRLRDLLPDTAGALLGWAALWLVAIGWARWGPRHLPPRLTWR